MNELKHKVDGIFRKVQKLLEQKQAHEDAIAKLQSEGMSLKTALREKDKLITSLNEEIKTIKLAKQLGSGTTGDSEFSDRINEMIKELDTVIGKLKTEKE